ncbi:hypothetical protein GCM10027578_32170 [Spirosoma luteolum]
MERTASQGDFRANLSKGGNGRSIKLSESETAMCVNAVKAVGLDFTGIDLIRGKTGQTYVTEVDGSPGTGIIDVTGQNYFNDLIRHIEARAKRESTVIAPVPLPSKPEVDKQQQENEEEAALEKVVSGLTALIGKEKLINEQADYGIVDHH